MVLYVRLSITRDPDSADRRLSDRRNLMAPDEMKNLGYAEDDGSGTTPESGAAVAGHTKNIGQVDGRSGSGK